MPNRAHETTRLGLFTVQACLPRTSLVRGFADAVRHSLEEVRVAFPRPGIGRCNCSLAGQGFAHRAVIFLRSRIRRCDALPRAYGKLPQVWGKHHLESCSHW